MANNQNPVIKQKRRAVFSSLVFGDLTGAKEAS